jgi:uncharacterized membrane protein
MIAQSIAATPAASRILPVSLWGVQGLLAAVLVSAGVTKLLTPADQLAVMIPWTAGHEALATLTGIVDLAGGLGILLPSLARVQPRLAVLAALGLIILQVLAAGFHLSRGEAAIVPMNVVLVALAAFVLWGRGKAHPVTSRA